MDQEQEKIIYDNADKFIELANELTKSLSYGAVGVAIRYAAARYSAFEASVLAKDFEEENEKHLEFFSRTFTQMLHKNFDEYLAREANKKKE